MNFNDYMQARGWLDAIDHIADIGEDTVYRLNELDQEAEQSYQKFVAHLEMVQRKILTVDSRRRKRQPGPGSEASEWGSSWGSQTGELN